MQYAALEQVLVNSIKEVQIKLGYEKEAIRFYYPEKALIKILNMSGESVQETKAAMAGFKEYVEERLGPIKISKSQGRFCFEIPPQGVEYVSEHVTDNGFLKEFIETVESPGVTLAEILGVFQKYTEGKVICIDSQEEECDCIIYFEDQDVDCYRYFIKFYENHVTYHRFLSEDVKDMGL